MVLTAVITLSCVGIFYVSIDSILTNVDIGSQVVTSTQIVKFVLLMVGIAIFTMIVSSIFLPIKESYVIGLVPYTTKLSIEIPSQNNFKVQLHENFKMTVGKNQITLDDGENSITLWKSKELYNCLEHFTNNIEEG